MPSMAEDMEAGTAEADIPAVATVDMLVMAAGMAGEVMSEVVTREARGIAAHIQAVTRTSAEVILGSATVR